jgi:hypothetical protein
MSMPAIRAYRDGLQRVARAPAVAVGLFAAVALLTAPAAALVRDALISTIGSSLVGARLASGFDLLWWQEVRGDAPGLVSDLSPSVIGFAAVLRNLSDLTGWSTASAASWTIVVTWLVVGTFLSGGILDRYARQRALHAHGFFAACGRLWLRLLRLNVLVLLLYAGLLWSYRLLAFPVWRWATRDLASERAAFAWALALGGLAAVLVFVVTAVADCARVRMVVEDRRSALFAVVAGVRYARRMPATLVTLYGLLVVTSAVVMGLYALVAPGASWAGTWVWVAWAIGELYVAARVLTKLLTYASITSLFQNALAHAGYVAQPVPIWPESPAVETLGPTVPPGTE